MAIRKIAEVGHPILREVAFPIDPKELQSPGMARMLDDLVETLRDGQLTALSAPQIYEPWAVTAVEVKHHVFCGVADPAFPLTILVNPKYEPIGEEVFECVERCPSVPELIGRVRRYARVQVSALDASGAPVELMAEGLTAGTLQRAVDHLDGRLFLDRIRDPRTLSTLSEFRRHRAALAKKERSKLVQRYHG